MKPFKEKVKEHRGQLGLSQKQLQKKPGLDSVPSLLMKLENDFHNQHNSISWQKH